MLEVDLNETVHLTDIKAPKGVEFTALEQDNNIAVATVSPARVEEVIDEEQDQPAEAAAKGESEEEK